MYNLEQIKGVLAGRAAVLQSVWSHPLNRGSRMRAVGDYLLWNAVKFTMEAQHVLRLTQDLEIILGRKENYGSAVYAHNLSDYHEMLFLAHMLRSEDEFLDVGSNAGMYSIWVTGVTGARSIAFEPVPDTYSLLIKNIRLNDLVGHVTAHQMAAGDEIGTISMTASQGGLDHVITDPTITEVVTVPINRVDSVCAASAPVAMKLDVEGYEMQALRGAEGVLKNSSLKAVVIELQDWTLNKFGTSEREVREFLRSFGFLPHVYDPETRSLTAAGNKNALNEIFIRDDKWVRTRLASGPIIKIPSRPNGI